MPRRAHWSIAPLAVLVTAPLQAAHAQLISFGVMAGASLSTFTGDVAGDIKNYAGFIAGGFVRIGALGFAVQPGLYYTAKGAKTSDFSEVTGQGVKTSLDYIEIPVVIRIHLGPLYVGAGPSVGIRLKCQSQSGSGATFDCQSGSGVKSTEVTGIGEAGLEFGKLSIGGRVDVGITNAAEALQSNNSSVLGYKTRTVSAVIAYRF